MPASPTDDTCGAAVGDDSASGGEAEAFGGADGRGRDAAHLGEVLWMMDRHEEARSVWERGESIDTKNKTLRETLRKFVK